MADANWSGNNNWKRQNNNAGRRPYASNDRQKQNTSASGQAYAPYNFVPFNDRVLDYEPELPKHDTLQKDFKTGEIHVTLRADTPIFISDGNKDFVRGANDTYMIPGSTIRGMLRENMQILGYGMVKQGEDLEDYQIYYRELAGIGETRKALRKYYNEHLSVKTYSLPAKGPNQRPSRYSVPENVSGGYLVKKGKEYFVYPTKEHYFKVSTSHADVQQFKRRDACDIEVDYKAEDGEVLRIFPRDKGGSDAKPGVLHCTGPIKTKNHLYLFPEIDRDEKNCIRVSDEDRLSFEADYESRKTRLKDSFWKLPEEDGLEKPVFYAKVGGHLYFGTPLFLRIGYRHSICDGLPKYAQSKRQDYPHALLGFAADQTNPKSYRSRISAGDFAVDGRIRNAEKAITVLGEPKPSYYMNYVEKGQNYENPDFRLRGYKQYWLREKPQLNPPPQGNENVASTLRLLPKDTAFRGVIRFKNLTEQELGLLLWSLRLEDGCYQTLGMGKPCGYGRMKLTIDKVRELNTDKLYSDAAGTDAWADTTGRINDYISAYDAFAAEKLGLNSIRDEARIQDFFYLKKTIRKDSKASYMPLRDHAQVTKPLPTVAEIRNSKKP